MNITHKQEQEMQSNLSSQNFISANRSKYP